MLQHLQRFLNPRIGDTIRRLCHDGSNRQPKFIMPQIRDRRAAGRSVEGLSTEGTAATLRRYLAG